MKEKKMRQKVILFTFSNYFSGNSGDSINDRKLINAIPSDFQKFVIYPKYINSKIPIRSILKFLVSYFKSILLSNNIIITHGSKLAIVPIILKKFCKNKIILRLGCTPLMFVERQAFSQNLDFYTKKSLIKKLFYFIEPQIEKFALRYADQLTVENLLSKTIILHFGAKEDKIKIIPYYVQDYFLSGKNPEFNNETDYFKIGYTGRFKKYDLLEPVINSISQLKDYGYKVKLYLIGDGPNRYNIENLVKTKNLTKNVIFKGSKSHREVSNLIDNYHCLALLMLNKLCPSTIAIKILEGVMKGKAIITSKSGNNPSLFLKYTDLILTNPSSENIIQKIKLIIENYNKYKEIAEKLGNYHKEIRSKKKNEERLKQILNEI